MRQEQVNRGVVNICVCVFVLQQNQATTPYQRPAETQKNQLKNQMWTGVLGITLVEGQDLPQYGQGDIYVRFRLGDQKYKSKVGHFVKLSLSSPALPFLMLLCFFFFFNVCSLYFKSFFPAPISYFPTSLSQQVSVSDSPPPWLTGPWQRQLIRLGKAATHFPLCLGCWASLPSFAYPACPVHLPVLVTSPLMILWCTCLVLLLYFFVNLSAFLSACLFVGQS